MGGVPKPKSPPFMVLGCRLCGFRGVAPTNSFRNASQIVRLAHDNQIASVRKKMLEICHCIKDFPAEGCSCPCRSITGGRKGNQLTKFSSTKWEDRGTCASSLRLAPRWRETKINLVLLPGYYRPGISQQAFSKASIDVLVPYSTGTVIVAATSILYGERRIYM